MDSFEAQKARVRHVVDRELATLEQLYSKALSSRISECESNPMHFPIQEYELTALYQAMMPMRKSGDVIMRRLKP